MKNFRDFRKYLREEDEESFSLDNDYDGSIDGDTCCNQRGEHSHNCIKASLKMARPHNSHMKFLSAKNLNQIKSVKRIIKKGNQKRKKNK